MSAFIATEKAPTSLLESRRLRLFGSAQIGPFFDPLGDMTGISLMISLDVSGSMVGERLQFAKNMISIVLDEMATRYQASAENDVRIVAWSSTAVSNREIIGADPNDYLTLTNYVNSLAASGGTDYPSAFDGAQDFFAQAGSKRKIMFFLTDGVGSNLSQAIAIRDSIPSIEVFAYNIILTSTTQTALLDNTPQDGVVIVNSLTFESQGWQTLYSAPYYGERYYDDTARATEPIVAAIVASCETNEASKIGVRIVSGNMVEKRLELVAQAGVNRLGIRALSGWRDPSTGSIAISGPAGDVLDNFRLVGTDGVNRIQNGSFEDVGNAVRDFWEFNQGAHGYTATGSIPGWTHVFQDTNISIDTSGYMGMEATDGFNTLRTQAKPDVGSNNGLLDIYQDIIGLTPGGAYTLTFDYGGQLDPYNYAIDDPEFGPQYSQFYRELTILWNGQAYSINLPNYDTIVSGMDVFPNRLTKLHVNNYALRTSTQIQVRLEGGGPVSIHATIVQKGAEALRPGNNQV